GTAAPTWLPLVVSVRRALAPVRSLLRTHRAFAGSRPFADARPLCRKLGRTAGKCSADGTTCRSASGDSQEISDITAARALGGFGARTLCSSAAGLAGQLRRSVRSPTWLAGQLRRSVRSSTWFARQLRWTLRATW